MSGLLSFLRLNNTAFYVYTTLRLYTHLLMDVCVASNGCPSKHDMQSHPECPAVFSLHSHLLPRLPHDCLGTVVCLPACSFSPLQLVIHLAHCWQLSGPGMEGGSGRLWGTGFSSKGPVSPLVAMVLPPCQP